VKPILYCAKYNVTNFIRLDNNNTMKVNQLLAITFAIISPHYSLSEETHHIFAKVQSENVPPHKGCQLLLKDQQPPQPKLVGIDFEKRGTSDYKVGREAGATAAVCTNGFSGGYPCNNVDLLSMLDLASLGAAIGGSNSANDIWGWTDISSGREFAIIGIQTGTAFVEITNPVNPIYLGALRTKTSNSSWRDIKTYGNFAYIVSEASNHGMQIIDLTELLTATQGTEFSESAHYSSFGNAHNIFINEDTGFAYVVGSNTCSGGLHMVDISDGLNPVQVGCYSGDGYTHDVQCVIYIGPDSINNGKEICFCSNEDTITVVDVTVKSSPKLLSRKSYANDFYTHQGWLTEDHSHFLFNDELDEYRGAVSKTTTHVMDVRNLNNIVYVGGYSGRTSAIDHNNYVKGDYLYQANYRAGLNVLKITDATNAQFQEVGYFDIWPNSDSSQFNGAWSNYPYFPSGNIVISGVEQGLFVVRFNNDGSTPAPTPVRTPAPTSSPIACDGSLLTVQLTTDIYPVETEWTVTSNNGSGDVVMTNPDLSSEETYITSDCLSEDCYVFKITDTYGDGICCNFGTGSFSVKQDGAEILAGGNFGSSASKNFCVGQSTSTSAPSVSPSASPTKSPTKSPTTEPLNDSNWVFKQKLTCDWVGRNANKRCKKIGSSSGETVKACDACRAACIDNPCPTIPPCEGNNSQWAKGSKNCDWVAGDPNNRCKRKGNIGSDRVRACLGCCETCSDIPSCA